jgi:hypothetical protein
MWVIAAMMAAIAETENFMVVFFKGVYGVLLIDQIWTVTKCRSEAINRLVAKPELEFEDSGHPGATDKSTKKGKSAQRELLKTETWHKPQMSCYVLRVTLRGVAWHGMAWSCKGVERKQAYVRRQQISKSVEDVLVFYTAFFIR